MKPLELVAYRVVSEVIGKAAFLVITILAARRLSREGFGIFAIGTTVGWIAVVASDFGLQMHLARAVSRTPDAALHLLRRWLRVRVAAALAALLVVGVGLSLVSSRAVAPAIALFLLGYLAAGLVEFLHHFYRGLARTDIESTLTIWLRLGTLAAAALALWLRPEPTVLAASMLVAPVLAAAYSARLAFRLASTVTAAGDTPLPTAAPTEFMRDVAPIGAGIVLSALYFRIDVFLLQAWQGIETVGLYSAVFRLIEAMRLFPGRRPRRRPPHARPRRERARGLPFVERFDGFRCHPRRHRMGVIGVPGAAPLRTGLCGRDPGLQDSRRRVSA